MNDLQKSPRETSNAPNFAFTRAAPYLHAAVSHSLAVAHGTEAAFAMVTMMSSPLMTTPMMCCVNCEVLKLKEVGRETLKTLISSLENFQNTQLSCFYTVKSDSYPDLNS